MNRPVITLDLEFYESLVKRSKLLDKIKRDKTIECKSYIFHRYALQNTGELPLTPDLIVKYEGDDEQIKKLINDINEKIEKLKSDHREEINSYIDRKCEIDNDLSLYKKAIKKYNSRNWFQRIFSKNIVSIVCEEKL